HSRLHPEYAELRPVGDWRVQRRGKCQPQDVTRLRGVDDPVIPQPRGRVPGIALRLIVLPDRLLEGFGLLGRPFVGVTVHGRKYARRLLAAHHADAAIGPGEEEARRIGPAGHAVIAGAEAAAD